MVIPQVRSTTRNSSIPLYWWRSGTGLKNFGDELAPIILGSLLGRATHRELTGGNRLLSVGSILDRAKPGDIIWGSGCFGSVPSLKNVKVFGVRGPLTQDLVVAAGGESLCHLGDPALLLPRVIPKSEVSVTERFEILIAPHFADTGSWHHFKSANVKRADVTSDPPERIVQLILSADLVLTSAMHVGIVAEAYGVPAVFISSANSGGEFKFRDYFLSTGRDFNTASPSLSVAKLSERVPPEPKIDLLQLEESLERLTDWISSEWPDAVAKGS